MKTFFFISLLFPLFVFAQTKDTIPANASVIIIKTGKSALQNYRILLTALVNNGYSIHEDENDTAIVDNNSDSLTVRTKEKAGNATTIKYYLLGLAKKDEIILTGKFTSKVETAVSGPITKDFTYDIANRGSRTSANRYTFDAMNAIAKSLNGSISYKTKISDQAIVTVPQTTDTIPQKNANTIVVQNDKSTLENYKLLLEVLVKNGYGIHIDDNDTMEIDENTESITVQTKERNGNSATVRYFLNGVAKKNEIVLFGKYSSSVETSFSGPNEKVFMYDIVNKGGKGSANRFTFDAMQSIAKSLNGRIVYLSPKLRKKAIF